MKENNQTTNKEITDESTINNKPNIKKSNLKSKILNTTLVLIFLILLSLITIHKTSLRFKIKNDPLGQTIENIKVKTAKTDVQKANAHLDISETRLNDFIEIKSKDSNNNYQYQLISEMITQNKIAISYMDKAKNNGQDIKKLNLVKKLCDLLTKQNTALAKSNTDINIQHEFSEKLEEKINEGLSLDKALEEVHKDLDAAMRW